MLTDWNQILYFWMKVPFIETGFRSGFKLHVMSNDLEQLSFSND